LYSDVQSYYFLFNPPHFSVTDLSVSAIIQIKIVTLHPKQLEDMKVTVIIVLLALLPLIITACAKQQASKQQFKNADTEEFAQLAADTSGVQLLDVRTAEEYAEGHIAGAVLIDVHTDAFLATARERLTEGKTVAVYCRSGRRSATAAKMLANEGYTVVNLKSGILGWIKAGKPTER